MREGRQAAPGVISGVKYGKEVSNGGARLLYYYVRSAWQPHTPLHPDSLSIH